MTRNLAARLDRLEAAKRSPTKARGILGGEYGQLIVDPEKPGHLKFSEPPFGFAEYARRQQADLQAELLRLFADTDEADAPDIVGIINNPAPLKPGQKAKNFIHLADGTEIRLKRN